MGRDTLHMAADWSAYEGVEVTGKVVKVFSRGELIIDEGRCLAEPGRVLRRLAIGFESVLVVEEVGR